MKPFYNETILLRSYNCYGAFFDGSSFKEIEELVRFVGEKGFLPDISVQRTLLNKISLTMLSISRTDDNFVAAIAPCFVCYIIPNFSSSTFDVEVKAEGFFVKGETKDLAEKNAKERCREEIAKMENEIRRQLDQKLPLWKRIKNFLS